MKYIAKIDNKIFNVQFEKQEDRLVALVNDKPIDVEILKTTRPRSIAARIKNRPIEVEISRNEHGYALFYKGSMLECSVEDERRTRLKRTEKQSSRTISGKELASPMPGLIVAIAVSPGQQVREGDSLLTIEAMKMENEIKASFDARVKTIMVKQGQTIEINQQLIAFE